MSNQEQQPADQKKKQASKQERIEKATQKKVNLAKEKGSRVLQLRTPDGHIIVNMTQSADRAIRFIRDRAGVKYPMADVGPFFEEWHDILTKFDAFNVKLHQFLGWNNYTTPPDLQQPEEKQ